ncbi:MAG TPA: alpha/beta fold hydrolase [Streptosporangiaceae bacterium]
MSIYRHPGTILTDHYFLVPLDHNYPDGEQIEVYAREVVATDKAGDDGLPWLLFLQGGPGAAAQRPLGREAWLDRALDDYRVLLLDQRGTGRSSPANRQTLARLGSAKAQAGYLAHFRADSIVLDAELIRRDLTGGEPWSVLGQSFGGFCTVSYLSFAPHGLREAFITGGLPGLTATADEVYRLTYPKVAGRNAAHYERYPGDTERVRELAGHLSRHDVLLPAGAPLTVRAFQSIGRMLGMSTGSHQLRYLLETAFTPDGELSDTFLYQMQAMLSFAATPLYALLHEPCYAQGAATSWSAERIRSEFGEFDAARALGGDDPVLFTGEMIYPWMIDADPVLRPLREAADLLAERADWPPLYDPARLAANEVPVAAAVYYDDMYVPRELSVPTANAINGLRPWITNEYDHDALRVSSGRVLDRLIAMVRGTVL